MFNVVSFSGGKDSTAMLLMMLEKGMRVDEIVMCDTGKEFPQMYEHIDKVNEYINECYGKHITILKADKSFDYLMYEHVKTRGKNKGKCGYGWANMRIRWCTSMLKSQVIDKHLKNVADVHHYIGIAYDEPKRHTNIADNVTHPLYEWGVTEAMALDYCYKHGFTWGGLYEHFDRVSCWCCPMKNTKELKALYEYYPALWQELKSMDSRAYNAFKGKGVQYYEDKFKNEEKERH